MSISVSFKYTPNVGLTSSDSGKEPIVLKEPLSSDPKRYSPTEMMLMAMAGCSTSDVLLIISKMHKKIDSFSVEIHGERHEEEPRLLKTAHFNYILSSDATKDHVLKAINLSLEKYCSVTLLARKAGVHVTYSLKLNGDHIVENAEPNLA